MVQKVVVSLVDDLDGTLGDDSEINTVHFGLDGVSYEIDLTDDNADTLRTILAGYIDHGRRTGGRLRRLAGSSNGTVKGTGTPPARTKEQTAAVRVWGRGNGFPGIADRGRIPQEVLEAYEVAHAPQARPTGTKKPRRVGKR
jgi:hypothetical protein